MKENATPIEMAVRCYPEPVSRTQHKGGNDDSNDELPSRALVFDTETTVDRYQNLNFGSFQVYEHGQLLYQGIFYGETVKNSDIVILMDYGKVHGIPIMPVRDFIDRIFLPEVHGLHTLCVGFNLPFDISRLAIKFGDARGSNIGGFSFKLSDNKQYPRIIIKHLDSKRAFIKFANGLSDRRGNARHKRGNPNTFRGHFLDLRTLAFTLTNESHSLASACKLFKADFGKTHPEEHGKISPEYIDYNINDVRATYSLFIKLKEEYERYHLDKMPTKLYSPASIGKAYFKEMGITPFIEKNPDFPKDVLGYLMTTYYGGRSEVRVRKTPMLINLIDFLSMYPTMCIIQNLWQFVICEHVDYIDDTENVRKFVETANLETLSHPEAWREFAAIVQIVPDGDILPVRSKYGEKHTYNIGVNHLTGETPVWYTFADILTSKLVTGKTPNILRAIRFVPRGIQNGLQSIRIVGDEEIDPVGKDFFTALMDYRHEVKKKRDAIDRKIYPAEYDRLESTQNIVKIITNSTSYGIFVEINTAQAKGAEVTVYGNGLEPFTDNKDKVETFGREFNPLIATFITSASRLVLAITESILAKHGAVYAFCDTDSMAIPPEHVAEVQDYFQGLSPYSFPDPLFKLEKENFGPDDKLQPLWFYGISAKRYVLYNMVNAKPRIRKHSLHGLGHLLDPFGKLKHLHIPHSQTHGCTDNGDMESNHVQVTTSTDLADLPNDLPHDLPKDLPVSTFPTTSSTTSDLQALDPFGKPKPSPKLGQAPTCKPMLHAQASNDSGTPISSPFKAQVASEAPSELQAPQAHVQATPQAQAPSPSLKPHNQPLGAIQDIWHQRIWTDILNLEYGLTDREALDDKYSSSFAVSKMAITSPYILKRFKDLNKGKPINMQIKPFNFMLVGVAYFTDTKGKLVKPIAPYSKDPQRIVYEDFVDYHSGEMLNGLQYWKPFGVVFWDYLNHKESKFNGSLGTLTRKHLTVKRITHIGKESDNLEETEHLGVGDDAYQRYADGSVDGKVLDDMKMFILNLKPQIAKRFGISRQVLSYWKGRIRKGMTVEIYGKTRYKLKMVMQKMITI